MTRQEFIDRVTNWWELIEFCNDEGCDVCEDVVDDDYKDEYVNDHLEEWARDNTWRDLLDILSEIPDDYSYYRMDANGDFEGLSNFDDFAAYKEDVLDWMDDRGGWDDEEEEELVDDDDNPFDDVSPFEDEEDEDEEDLSDEPLEILELVSASHMSLEVAAEAESIAEAKAEQEFIDFIKTA